MGLGSEIRYLGKTLFRIPGQKGTVSRIRNAGKKYNFMDQQHLVAVPGVEHLLDAEEEALLHVARTGGVLPAAPAAQGVAARYRGRWGGRMEKRRRADVFRLRRGRVSGALAASNLRINDM